MTNPLKQLPDTWLSLDLCEKLYKLYLNNTHEFFILPAFEERYVGKIEGILGSVSQSFDESYLFPTIEKAAAAYFVKISTQHPFRDGNKRMAVYLTDIFLSLNGIYFKMGWKEMYELAKFVVMKKEAGIPPEQLQEFVEIILNKYV